MSSEFTIGNQVDSLLQNKSSYHSQISNDSKSSKSIEPEALDEDQIIKDLCYFGGIYLVKRYVQHMENSAFFKAWNDYLDNGFNNRIEVIKIISQGLTDFIVDDARLKMMISFLEGHYNNSYIGELQFLTEMLDRSLLLLHTRISSALESSLMDIPYETVLFALNTDTSYENYTRTDNFNFSKGGQSTFIKAYKNSGKSQESENELLNNGVTIESISIFDLAKVIYFKAFKRVKSETSENILKRLFVEGTRKMLPDSVVNAVRGKSIKQCKELLKRMIVNERDEHVVIMRKLLLAAEDIVDSLWGILPDLKPSFPVKYKPLTEALDDLLESGSKVSSRSSSLSSINRIREDDVFIDGSAIYLKHTPTQLGKDLPELKPFRPPSRNSDLSSRNITPANNFDPDEPDWPRTMKQTLHLPGRKKQDLQAHLISTVYSEHTAIGRSVNLRNKYVEFSFLLEEKVSQTLPLTVAKFFPVERSKIDDSGVKLASLNYALKDGHLTEDVLAKCTKLTYMYEGRPLLCAGCGFLIHPNRGVRCLDESWHEEHMMCATCNASLTGRDMAFHRGLPLCIPHYLAVKSSICNACHHLIIPSQDAVLYKGELYHDKHITCKWCFGQVPSEEKCCSFTPR